MSSKDKLNQQLISKAPSKTNFTDQKHSQGIILSLLHLLAEEQGHNIHQNLHTTFSCGSYILSNCKFLILLYSTMRFQISDTECDDVLMTYMILLNHKQPALNYKLKVKLTRGSTIPRRHQHPRRLESLPDTDLERHAVSRWKKWR